MSRITRRGLLQGSAAMTVAGIAMGGASEAQASPAAATKRHRNVDGWWSVPASPD